MESNNYGYISFPMPPPNFNSSIPGFNQNWISAHYQSQSSTNPSTSGLQKLTNSSPPQNGLNTTTDSKQLLSNSKINLPNSKCQEIMPPLPTQPHPSTLMTLPPLPPPPPPYLPPSTPIATATPTNYYMPSSQQVYSSRYSPAGLTYPTSPVLYSPVGESYPSTATYYSAQPMISTSGHMTHYQNTSPQGYSRNNYYKRKNDPDMDSPRGFYRRRSDESDSQRRNTKKRKKPLSQNIPQRKDWSVREASRAIEVEKDFNKRNRSHSLIIKFPDADLNREIVSGFHPGIENVHFQQPSTPRFCFVTLKENAKAADVINRLNKTRFGHGFLTAEHKKDREDEMNIGPEDIDPLTLYVGNLAQDVIKEDMVRIYPKHKRVDIGYAKKMKYTRYAFVSFKNVDDSIEAFKKTHATQLYNKSLIVRFRRLHGTVGMPGEPKPQLPQRSDSVTSLNSREEISDSNSNHPDGQYLAPWDLVDVSAWTRRSSIKREPLDSFSDDDDDLEDYKPLISSTLELAVPSVSPEISPEENFPQPKKVKVEYIKSELSKTSKENETEANLNVDLNNTDNNNSISERQPSSSESVKRESEDKKISTYKQLLYLNSDVRKLPSIRVKKEITDSPPESTLSSTASFRNDLEEATVAIKTEPMLDDDYSNDGDRDNSSGDQFDFDNIISKFESKKNNKKKRFKDVLL